MGILKRVRASMEAVANVVSTAILILFYFTIFALFAVPLKLTVNYLKSKGKDSNYITSQNQYDTLDSLRNE